MGREAEWRRRLDLATLTASESELQRTRLVNDKLRLQQEMRRREDNPHVLLYRKQSNLDFVNSY